MPTAAAAARVKRKGPDRGSSPTAPLTLSPAGAGIRWCGNPRNEDLEYQQRIYRLSTGKNWSKRTHFTPDGQNKTSIVRRTYLADAAFLIEIQSDYLSEISSALLQPVFTQYLGRKAFAPTFPFILGIGQPGKLATLPTWERKQPASKSVIYDEWFNTSEVSVASPQLRVDHYLTPHTEPTVTFIQVKSQPWIQWLQTVSSEMTIPQL